MRGPLDPRLGAALPAGQPFGDLLQAAQRARRLGQLGLAADHLGLGGEIGSRQVAQDPAHFIEGGSRHCLSGGILEGAGPSYIRGIMTSPHEPSFGSSAHRPASFDEWLQAFKEQMTFFTGLKLDVGLPRWQLADVLPVLPVVGAAIGLASGLVFAIVRGIAGPGWLAAVLAVGAAIILTRALHEDGLADTADGLGPHGLEPARRLEIMRDSRNGTFGVLALALTVLIKVACLAQFGAANRTRRADFGPRFVARRAGLSAAGLFAGPCRRAGRDGGQAGRQRRLDHHRHRRGLAFLLMLGKGLFVAILAPLAVLASAWFTSHWSQGGSAAIPATRWAPCSRRRRSCSSWWRHSSSAAKKAPLKGSSGGTVWRQAPRSRERSLGGGGCGMRRCPIRSAGATASRTWIAT
jgi:adenosylcobinamide-GDP ribazoletransferase